MGKRLESVERTRRTIIDAARELLAEGGPQEFSVQRIAERAGVTRPTVYERFGSRREFLEALVADAEQRAGLAAVIAASEHPDAIEAMVAWLRGAVAFWASEQAVLGSAFALSHTDPDLSGVLAAHDQARRRRAARLVTRLASAHQLRDDCPPEQATESLWLLSGLPVYQQLSRDGHRSLASVTRTVVHLAVSAVVAPGNRP